ncbi:hypothetical protein HGRIS_012664 [Hohenbuehelia grisea]|uniref:Uncharacterized protein n=1 Tax=Hohenbuehelia grisea TaxID=104357 RepID=A0ABR3ISZ3_9AGAR
MMNNGLNALSIPSTIKNSIPLAAIGYTKLTGIKQGGSIKPLVLMLRQRRGSPHFIFTWINYLVTKGFVCRALMRAPVGIYQRHACIHILVVSQLVNAHTAS